MEPTGTVTTSPRFDLLSRRGYLMARPARGAPAERLETRPPERTSVPSMTTTPEAAARIREVLETGQEVTEAAAGASSG
jgi:hypothetical protein